MEHGFSEDLVVYLCGAAAFAVVVLVWTALLDRNPLEGRLKAIADRRSEFETASRKKNTRRASMQRVGMMKKIVEKFRMAQGESIAGLRMKLRQAGIQSRDAMFVFLFFKLVMVLAVAAGAGLFAYALPVIKGPAILKVLVMLVGAAIGWIAPDIFIKNQAQKRAELLRLGMPDALDLLVICAEAGLSLDSAFDRVAREVAPTYPELGEEMGLTGVELSFLPDRHQALKNLSERVPLTNVLALVNTLIQTEKYGTPLAQALRVLSGEMREDRIMRAEEKAAKLPATLTVPMILFILPPLFCVLIGPAAIRVVMALSHGS